MIKYAKQEIVDELKRRAASPDPDEQEDTARAIKALERIIFRKTVQLVLVAIGAVTIATLLAYCLYKIGLHLTHEV